MTATRHTRQHSRFSPTAMALALGCASVAFAGGAPAAADPAPEPRPLEITATGPYSGEVPDGVCALRSTVVGASGGSNMSGQGVSAPDANGGGASITTVYSVVPGMRYAGTIGGGGDQGAVLGGAGGGGSNGGGAGGAVLGAVHPGAGGGGWTDLNLGGSLVVLAGGGGGSAGGHSLNEGFGGNAGIPTAAGVTVGSDGRDGREPSGDTVGGGRGGGTDAPGAGGINDGNAALSGTAGDDRTGGTGGSDRDPDAGGGGGGGYFGGGGGASTTSAQGGGPPVIDGVAGAGGGGGSSYVAAESPDGSGSPVDLVDSAVGELLETAGDGADGSVTLEWLPCAYDLTVEKTAAPQDVQNGERVTWTVIVRNAGPQPMTRGDLVTVTDSLTGTGTATIESITPFRDDPAGAPGAGLDATPLTCSAGPGDPMPATLECSRTYGAAPRPGSPSGGRRGLDVGEGITVIYSQTLAGEPGETISNTARVTDRATGDSNDSATAGVDIAAPPPVVDDVGVVTEVAPAGQPVVLDPTAEIPELDPSSVLLAGPRGTEVTALSVPGEGTWSVGAPTGEITFTPVAGLSGDPEPVRFVGATRDGSPVTGRLRVDYRSAAAAPGAPGAPGAPAAPAPGGGNALASTGPAPIPSLVASAGILLTIGAALLVLARRRRMS